MNDLILFLHAGSTCFMVGLIWFVQIVHYPLFAHVGDRESPNYAARHQSRTTLVVAPVMLIELITTTIITLGLTTEPPPTIERWLGPTLLAIAWLSTACVQVPLHGKLATGHTAPVIRRLVATNWIRTVAWTGRGVIALRLLAG